MKMDKPLNSIDQNKIYYDQRFGASLKHPGELNWEEQIRWQKIQDILKPLLNNHLQGELQILDFGCGRGWLSNALSAFGKVTGVDLSPESVKRAQEVFPLVRFLALDASIPAENQLPVLSFDLIVSSEVIEHIENQEAYVRNIQKLLKPGGYLLLTTPNGTWFNHHFYNERLTWKQPLEKWLTANRLSDLIGPAFRVEQLETFNAGWLFDYRTYGWPGFISLPVWRKILTLLNLKKNYLEFLEKKGYGLYLIMAARKN